MPADDGPRQWFFDVWSRFYDLPPVQRAIYRPVQDAVLAELRRASARRVVDVGCGTGLLTGRFGEELGAELVCGCDFSLGMLQQAAARGRGGAWVQADALRLPLRGSTVDAVVSTESFHWFPDQDAAMAEFHRVLAPGGRFVVAMVNPSAATLARSAHRVSTALGEPARWPTREELREGLERAGFEVERQRRVMRVSGLLFPPIVTVARRAG
jgi:ubiquinone/menaquinone biosynthesis C-methylase UbiE